MVAKISGTTGLEVPVPVAETQGGTGNVDLITAIQGKTIKSGAVINTTSGTFHDFTGIPNWVKKITIMFDGVSTNGTSNFLIQLGDVGGIEPTGYISSSHVVATGPTFNSSGILIVVSRAAAENVYGIVTLDLLDAATFKWVSTSTLTRDDGLQLYEGAGYKATSATLDRLRLTTVNGTDLFDAGSINILMEG
jgi:hypothetical protein